MDELTLERAQDPAQPGKQVVKITGGVTIGAAQGFKDELLAALKAASEVEVDVSGLTGIDLTGLQLLCAAHQAAGSGGKAFHVMDGGNPVFREMALGAGFLRHTGCANDRGCSCIWVGGDI